MAALPDEVLGALSGALKMLETRIGDVTAKASAAAVAAAATQETASDGPAQRV
ncbi:MAG TPA: MarR family transcriptional regulator, partial [Paraburkholderia sp.]|nr:MarR family transcriptional regulator [Paraburkholderia sp.]